jgi:hypothetical protein
MAIFSTTFLQTITTLAIINKKFQKEKEHGCLLIDEEQLFFFFFWGGGEFYFAIYLDKKN